MASSRRFLPVGVPAHVILRGHNRMAVFTEPSEFEFFLIFLQHAAACADVSLHAFALMSTHVHLIVTAHRPNAIAKMAQCVGARYGRYFNTRHGRSGAIWQGRYRAQIIDTDRYFYACLRYVERNPVAAGIVEHPDEYAWSSYAAHALGEWPQWLTPHPLYLALGRTPLERQAAYRALCDAPLAEGEVAWLRYVADHDWPYGILAFQRLAAPLVSPEPVVDEAPAEDEG